MCAFCLEWYFIGRRLCFDGLCPEVSALVLRRVCSGGTACILRHYSVLMKLVCACLRLQCCAGYDDKDDYYMTICELQGSRIVNLNSAPPALVHPSYQPFFPEFISVQYGF